MLMRAGQRLLRVNALTSVSMSCKSSRETEISDCEAVLRGLGALRCKEELQLQFHPGGLASLQLG